ncbi:iron ABC transporter [Erwinia sp. OLTSP20]|uniref:FecCD family ABC transporter permease n=1 Tax=unclassified Erwinia TaxID=2622719 RepID=UPI000C190FFF|nr:MULTISPECIES: iron ABC transporter permease [unclassified Erwinia]PIJ50238.1 iron ABC transporter [Erwinia sp. OAMSP11]PIJ72076.1 iron ABC transporter [Erwinia sp. OLSSP12]PIJ81367.1 iron ABC transporter [Erwinia sp. OLCASP19]PIJ84073.1 iron ABC transporter [Erwinia sp. OLMTSP26]PIJ85772.1 iron ABC transporter [Erwinia sp. OLMDSP33]
MKESHPRRWLALMLLLMLLMMILAANIGAMRLTLSQVWRQPGDSIAWQVWWTIRLPRVLLAVLVGGALAMSGGIMQGLFRNPLADPGLLGISGGAALTVALSVVFSLTSWFPGTLALWLPTLAAFIGSLAVTLVIFALSRDGSGSLARLLLVGVAINALCGSAVGVLSWLSSDQQLRQLSLWGMGSLGQAQWSLVLPCASLMLPVMLLVQRLTRRLNLLQLGEEEAHYLGVDVALTQRQLLVLSALLVAASVAVSGIIGFVGLVVPHLMRMCLGGDHRWMLPGSVLAGAMLLLLADTLARTLVAPAEMPVGLMTSLIGGPWFLWLILRRPAGEHD